MTGIYVHIPFCRRKCLYCDFFSVGHKLADWEDYISAVIAEAEAKLSGLSGPFTLYIGGGTPSLIPFAQFRRLADSLLAIVGSVVEFTVEVNPDDVTPGLASEWSNAGVDRISMGVQSLVDNELAAIGRRHDARAARKAYDTLRRNFPNVSLDVMFGLPGQTLQSLKKTVEGIITMNPQHVSAYSLTFEERSALTRMRDKGMVREIDETDSFRMFSLVCDLFSEAGYEQYEISNFARAGYRARHNSLYWDASPYVGLGAGAHGYDGSRQRTYNLPDIKSYVDFWLQGKGEPPEEKELLDNEALREEMIMTRLRTLDGLSLGQFQSRFGINQTEQLTAALEKWERVGKVVRHGDNVSLTREGLFISDEIISSLF